MDKLIKYIIAVILGNLMEFFDFMLYASFASFLNQAFFPKQSILPPMILVFTVFAIGFLVRPIGGLIYGKIGDEYGHRKALALSALVMAVACLLMACLPSYATIGSSAFVLFLLLRMVFGLSVGGELPGAMVILSESVPQQRRSFFSSFAMSGISLGLLLGSLVSLIVFHSFNTQQVLAYGWRLAYGFGALVALIAFVLRYYGEDHHVIIGKIVQSPIVDSFVKFKRDIVKAMSIQLLPAVGFQFVFIYPLSFLKQYRHWPSSWMAALSVVLLTAFFFLVIFCSLLSDC